jgi:DNA-binding XRE family transcriptional regulator
MPPASNSMSGKGTRGIMKQNFLLRLARINAGLTQEELADVLGVTSVTIYRWERGENIPNPYFRGRLCRLFQLSEQELGWTGLEDEKWTSDYDSSFLVDPYVSTNKATLIGQQALLHEMATSRHHIIGVTGLPGSGKTAVAHALASLQEIRQQVEGILWASVGQGDNPLRHFQRWILLLGGKTGPDHLEEAQDFLRVMLGGRKMLILLDDLWDAHDITPYSLGPQCRYVLTTRLPILANTVCDAVYSPLRLTDTQTFNLLTNGLPSSLVRKHREVLHALGQQVGNLPGAIEQIGRYLRCEARSYSQRRFQDALTHLFHPTTYLNIQTPPDAISLSALIKRSEDQLSSSSRKAFFALATHFPSSPASFSERQVVDLIRASRQFQLGDLDQLVDVGLLSGAGRNRYEFHPVVAAYARLLTHPKDGDQ